MTCSYVLHHAWAICSHVKLHKDCVQLNWEHKYVDWIQSKNPRKIHRQDGLLSMVKHPWSRQWLPWAYHLGNFSLPETKFQKSWAIEKAHMTKKKSTIECKQDDTKLWMDGGKILNVLYAQYQRWLMWEHKDIPLSPLCPRFDPR